MGLKKVRIAEETKKEVPAKKEPVKKQQVEPKKKDVNTSKNKVAPIVKKETVEQEIERIDKIDKQKSDWNGIGIIGTNDTIKKFKSICAQQGLKMGKILVELLTEFNFKNTK